MTQNADSERDIWHRQLAKVGIPEQYWEKIIEAAHSLETPADDGMRVVWDRETMHGPSVLPSNDSSGT